MAKPPGVCIRKAQDLIILLVPFHLIVKSAAHLQVYTYRSMKCRVPIVSATLPLHTSMPYIKSKFSAITTSCRFSITCTTYDGRIRCAIARSYLLGHSASHHRSHAPVMRSIFNLSMPLPYLH